MRLASIVSAEREARPPTQSNIVELPTAPPKYEYRAIQGPRVNAAQPQSQSQTAENIYPQNMGPMGLDQYR